MVPFLQSFGTAPSIQTWLLRLHIHFTIVSPLAFIISTLIASMSAALLFLRAFMAFLTSSLLNLPVHMGRVSMGSSTCAVMVRVSLFRMSQECSTHQTNFSSPLDNKVPFFALMGPDFNLKLLLIFFDDLTDSSHVIVQSNMVSEFSLPFQPALLVFLCTVLDLPVLCNIHLVVCWLLGGICQHFCTCFFL